MENGSAFWAIHVGDRTAPAFDEALDGREPMPVPLSGALVVAERPKIWTPIGNTDALVRDLLEMPSSCSISMATCGPGRCVILRRRRSRSRRRLRTICPVGGHRPRRIRDPVDERRPIQPPRVSKVRGSASASSFGSKRVEDDDPRYHGRAARRKLVTRLRGPSRLVGLVLRRRAVLFHELDVQRRRVDGLARSCRMPDAAFRIRRTVHAPPDARAPLRAIGGLFEPPLVRARVMRDKFGFQTAGRVPATVRSLGSKAMSAAMAPKRNVLGRLGQSQSSILHADSGDLRCPVSWDAVMPKMTHPLNRGGNDGCTAAEKDSRNDDKKSRAERASGRSAPQRAKPWSR